MSAPGSALVPVRVRYRYGEEFQNQQQAPTGGIYTLHDTDDMIMTGFVEIRDELGRIFVVNAGLLEVVDG